MGGVPGVGDKTAAKWLTAHGDLPGVLENAASIGGKVGEKLRDHITEVERNFRLNRLLDDVDLGLSFDDLTWGEGDPAELSSLFDQLEAEDGDPEMLANASIEDFEGIGVEFLTMPAGMAFLFLPLPTVAPVATPASTPGT